MTKFEMAIILLKDKKCKVCEGGGELDDAEMGDIYFNRWVCPHCKGTGFEGGKVYHAVEKGADCLNGGIQ